MKHRHFDMICAKAANMDLVVFEKRGTATHEPDLFAEIKPQGNKAIWFDENCDYFLCLPQHKEAVLNILNGGESQVKYDNWSYCNLGASNRWSNGWWYMDEKCESRIKPRKEKRWIGVNVKTGETTSAYVHDDDGNYAIDEVRLTQKGDISDWQFIEIEVEV